MERDEFDNPETREDANHSEGHDDSDFYDSGEISRDVSDEISAELGSARFGPTVFHSDSGRFGHSIGESESERFDRTNSFMWEEEREKEETDVSEVEIMKERFAKLLLGEDMSGGSKGVCCALAISNAITNLSASVFGEKWKLAPISPQRKRMWRREMEWMLCVSDHIVELVPAWHVSSDGHQREVMVTKQRADLHANLPALRKLDNMLLETLDSFEETEFWYEKPGTGTWNSNTSFQERHRDKWWLPMPCIPPEGLSKEARRHLQHHRDIAAQVLKAAMAINSQVLSEMEIPDAYIDSLPKTAKAGLGDHLYRIITLESCSPDQLLVNTDLTTEHSALESANKLESAIYIWRRRLNNKTNNPLRDSKTRNMGKIMRDFRASDTVHCEEYADRAEAALLLLRQKCPGLPQTALDGYKIQYNRDVGKSILESYSRVLESMASNIVSRIEDVIYADDLTRSHSGKLTPGPTTTVPRRFNLDHIPPPLSTGVEILSHDIWETSPNYSPSPTQTPTSPLSVQSDSSIRVRMWRRRPPGLPAPSSRHSEVLKSASISGDAITMRPETNCIGVNGSRSPPRGLVRTLSVGHLDDGSEKGGSHEHQTEPLPEHDSIDAVAYGGDRNEPLELHHVVLSPPRRGRSRSGPITKEDMANVGAI